MRATHCERCRTAVAFEAQHCPRCHTVLGYVPRDRTIRALTPTTDPAVFDVDGDDQTWWRCLNAAWGCNWMVPAAAGDIWCRSCRLTRGRPDEERTDAVQAWMTAESAKRRLVHQLDSLALPIIARSPEAPDGLAFDLVHLDDDSAITGHAGGVVTLDLAETDDTHRDLVREQLSEQYRTVIGHLRHEIGHHYWNRLVGQSDHLGEFRRLFGDEREDYAARDRGALRHQHRRVGHEAVHHRVRQRPPAGGLGRDVRPLPPHRRRGRHRRLARVPVRRRRRPVRRPRSSTSRSTTSSDAGGRSAPPSTTSPRRSAHRRCTRSHPRVP